ncbi:GNAT family N-acetyltransferase [Leekyejoonella antrihumi]|uniref:GNAT family N-acetyltransferase n=1 Tax=Leekyejoonella antrihumi TaxID=1660198 RepID=A0A563DX53_9MICO|nr:GNAT family N-acetyltransferase [Leekyejoonella antrihumi]TWP34551.1 GNAT family N-acetyltransferase [Leekyejoonella antrihumi]
MELPLRMPRNLPRHGEVRLRAFNDRDVGMLLNMSTDPYVPLIGTLPANTDRAGALGYIERQHDRLATGTGYSFCIALTTTDQAVGGAGLWLTSIEQGRATAGYAIAPRHRGRGLAGEALRALTTFAWTLPEVQRIELYIEPWNTASERTAQTADYQCEGLLRSHQVIDGNRVDMLLYAAVA